MNTNRQLNCPCSIRCAAALCAYISVFTWSLSAPAAEHPKKEHPTASTASAPTVTLDDVAHYVGNYVKEISRKGVFTATDKVTGKELSLALDKVHRERLSQVGPDMYFVCADFKTSDGKKVYDLDLFVQGTSKDNLKVVPGRTTVHKEDGNVRYTWAQNEQTGNWEQHPVGEAAPMGGGKAEPPKKEHAAGQPR